MAALIWRRLTGLWRAANARIDQAIIAWAVKITDEGAKDVGFGTRPLRKRNASHDRNSHQPHQDQNEP
jgi:hypothetical protein